MQDAGPGGVLFDRQYSYNTANQISQIAELTGTKVFGYDNIDRLTSVADAVNGNESYAFDGVGNRTASHSSNTYTHQPFNRLTVTETGSYSQDANGNTVSKVEGSKRWTYTWDHENRLTQAWDRKTRVQYRYDALGRRVERNLGFGLERTKFTYDGEDVLLDDANGTHTKYQNGPGIDNKLSLKTGSAVSYFLADHLGSTNGLADASGSLTAQTGYDSFGNQTTNLPTRYGFTGRERDGFTGMIHYRARHYDPRLGRFISEDPIGFAGGDINLYGYVRNNPLMFKDPDGKLALPILIVGGAVVAELTLHYALMEYADRIRFSDPDAFGRKRHCWVNCMSTRIHFGNPFPVVLFGGGKEGMDLIRNGDFSDSLGDMKANAYGQMMAYIVWRNCKDLCDGCGS